MNLILKIRFGLGSGENLLCVAEALLWIKAYPGLSWSSVKGSWLDTHLEPVFMAVPKPILTEFGIHYSLESCQLLWPFLSIVIQENKAAFLERKQFDAVQKKPFHRICASTSFHWISTHAKSDAKSDSLQLFKAKLFLGIRRLDSIIGVATFSREFWPRKFFRVWYPIHKLF